MKGLVKQQMSTDGQSIQKEQEKSKALFLEVVRVGKEQENTTREISALQQLYKNSLHELSQRFEKQNR